MVRGGARRVQSGKGGLWAMIERKLPGGLMRSGPVFRVQCRVFKLVHGMAGRNFWQARVAATIAIKNTTCSGLQ